MFPVFEFCFNHVIYIYNKKQMSKSRIKHIFYSNGKQLTAKNVFSFAIWTGTSQVDTNILKN